MNSPIIVGVNLIVRRLYSRLLKSVSIVTSNKNFETVFRCTLANIRPKLHCCTTSVSKGGLRGKLTASRFLEIAILPNFSIFSEIEIKIRPTFYLLRSLILSII